MEGVGFTPDVLEEPQPSIECGVRGGATPLRGRVMLDTGAAFSLMSLAAANTFGLEVRTRPATFTVANGASAAIMGYTDVSLQLHDEL